MIHRLVTKSSMELLVLSTFLFHQVQRNSVIREAFTVVTFSSYPTQVNILNKITTMN